MKLDLSTLSIGEYRLTVMENGGYAIEPVRDDTGSGEWLAEWPHIAPKVFDAQGNPEAARPSWPRPIRWINSPSRPTHRSLGDIWEEGDPPHHWPTTDGKKPPYAAPNDTWDSAPFGGHPQ